MTPTRTPFAGLERLAPGDPLSSDGYKFQDIDRGIIDRLLRLGAVTHLHDAHAAMANPSLAPTLSTGTGGSIAASTHVSVSYTLNDADGGETLPVAPVVVTTPAGYTDPTSAPATVLSHAAGTLLAGNKSYAVTVTDGLGGETAIGPTAEIAVPSGFANNEVAVSGLTAITHAASGSDPAAGWRLWRMNDGGGPWFLIATGSAAADSFTDTGATGNCTVTPPFASTTLGYNSLSVIVPTGQPAAAVTFNIYASLDGSFTNPCLLATLPVGDLGAPQVFTSLAVSEGAPPAVSSCFPGASKIDAQTEIVNLHWLAPVTTSGSLPSTGNSPGDARVALDTGKVWVWAGGAWGTSGTGGPAGGDLSGTYPNPTVAKVNGVAITNAPTVGGEVLTSIDATHASWQTPAGGGGGGGGGLTGPPLILDVAAATTAALEIGVTGNADQSLVVDGAGTMHFSDGSNPSEVQLALDVNFWGRRALGIYPENGGTQTDFSVYGGDLAPDGTGTAGGYWSAVAQSDRAELYVAGNWVAPSPYLLMHADTSTGAHYDALAPGAGRATLRGSSGVPGAGTLELQCDTTYTRPDSPAISLTNGSPSVPVWVVDYEGSMTWEGGSHSVHLKYNDPLLGSTGLHLYPDPIVAKAEINVLGGDLHPGPDGSRGAGGFRSRVYADNTMATVGVGFESPSGAGSYQGIAQLVSTSGFIGLEASDGFGTVDTHLGRIAAGVWQITEHGGGIRLTSPDGTQTKTIQLSNAGALVLV